MWSVGYARTKNHVEISDIETGETMYHPVPTLFLFIYVVSQEYVVIQAAEIRKIHKMYVRNDFSQIY